MIDPADLQQDHAMLSQLLTARRGVTMETLSVGERLLWQIYLTILEDALKTLKSLIDHRTAHG